MAKHDAGAPSRGKRDGLVNVLGIVLAFGIAFGGLFLVRNRLLEEEKALLQGEGQVFFISQTSNADEQSSAAVMAEKVILTAEELTQIVGRLDRASESSPHEPLPGQLSMSEAIECGREWLEDFLMPHLEAEEYISQEYRASCYLMVLPEDSGDSGLEEEMLGYWMVTLENRNMEAALILHGVTGQVLDASARCYFPIEHMEKEYLRKLLEEYSDSFGLKGEYVIVGREDESPVADDLLMFQGVGDTGVFAAIKTSNLAVSLPYGEAGEYQEIFNIRLFLDLSIY